MYPQNEELPEGVNAATQKLDAICLFSLNRKPFNLLSFCQVLSNNMCGESHMFVFFYLVVPLYYATKLLQLFNVVFLTDSFFLLNNLGYMSH